MINKLLLLFSFILINHTTVYADDLSIKEINTSVIKIKKGHLRSTCSLQIKNITENTLKIAILKPFQLSLDNGIIFNDKDSGKLTGIKSYRDRVAVEKHIDEMQIIKPNQQILITFNMDSHLRNDLIDNVPPPSSGELTSSIYFVNQNTGKGWESTLSLNNIPIKWNVR